MVRQAIRQAHGPERLKVLSLVEGLTTLSEVEGKSNVLSDFLLLDAGRVTAKLKSEDGSGLSST